MNRQIDKLGRIVLPKEMRDAIGLENETEAYIELQDDKIVVTNAKGMRSKETILAMKHSMDKTAENKNEYQVGFIKALEWVLNEERRVDYEDIK